MGVLAGQVLGPADADVVDAVLLADQRREAVADPGRDPAARAAALAAGLALGGVDVGLFVRDALGARFRADRDRPPVGLGGDGAAKSGVTAVRRTSRLLGVDEGIAQACGRAKKAIAEKWATAAAMTKRWKTSW